MIRAAILLCLRPSYSLLISPVLERESLFSILVSDYDWSPLISPVPERGREFISSPSFGLGWISPDFSRSGEGEWFYFQS